MVGILVLLGLGSMAAAVAIQRSGERRESYGRIREDGHERVRVRGRGLSALEKTEARKVFGDTIDYDRVILKKTLHPWHSFAGGAVLPYDVDEGEQEYVYKLLFDRGWLRSIIRSTGEKRSKLIYDTDEGSVCYAPLPYGIVLMHELMHIRQMQRMWKDAYWKKFEEDERRQEESGVSMYNYGPWIESGVPFEQWPLEAQAVAAGAYYTGIYHGSEACKDFKRGVYRSGSWFQNTYERDLPVLERVFSRVRAGEL